MHMINIKLSYELVPKLIIASPDLVFQDINEYSDYENYFENSETHHKRWVLG